MNAPNPAPIPAHAVRLQYTVADLLAMQGDAPLLVDAEWDTMPAAGRECTLDVPAPITQR